MEAFQFKKAVPVWEQGMEQEMNRSLIFRTVLDMYGQNTAACTNDTAHSSERKKAKTTLFITGHSDYKVYINGIFFAAGPARAAHDYYRVDELPVSDALTQEKNVISIIVAGYNVNSFYLLDLPPFLCAEVVTDQTVVAATSADAGTDAFQSVFLHERIQRVQRYSFQRPFCEVYHLDAPEAAYASENAPMKLTESTVSSRAFITDASYTPPLLTLAQTEHKNFLKRGIYYPDYQTENARRCIASGTVSRSEKERYYSDRSVVHIGEQLKGFPISELEVFSAKEAQKLDFHTTETAPKEGNSVSLCQNTFYLFDMGLNLSGFIELDAEVSEDTELYLLFDEILRDGDVDFLRMQCGNVVIWKLKKGFYRLHTFEPYTLRYLKAVSLGGKVHITNLRIRRLNYRKDRLRPRARLTDDVLCRIYDAAIETFSQNTFDIYMDCPSRERAGWLCDSFFTSRVEYALTGETQVENNFIENYILPERFKYLPKGMLPMCYPADHYDGVFIPNWAMWLALELEEYKFNRNGDAALIKAAESRLYALLSYLRRFENEDGLLEHLESWVFVEWSRSNSLTQDINYPTNMLYCGFKRALARLYGDSALAEEADRLAQTIRNRSYLENIGFFCDNSVYRTDGQAHLSGECTESCQYYAFFFNIATPETYPKLWQTLVSDFGPARKESKLYPEIAFSNAFIGNYLRLELLFRYGIYDKVVENIKGYFDYMATRTGTLWEHDSDHASCNHGFASHIIYWLDKIFG